MPLSSVLVCGGGPSLRRACRAVLLSLLPWLPPHQPHRPHGAARLPDQREHRPRTSCREMCVLFIRLLLVSALAWSASAYDEFGSSAPPRLSVLRMLEKSLQGTAGVVRGVGDTLAVSTGGTIRIIGGSIQKVGGGLEGLGDAVAGGPQDSSGADDHESPPKEIGDALRSVASRPVRALGSLMRSIGDTTNFLGDTTERFAGQCPLGSCDDVRRTPPWSRAQLVGAARAHVMPCPTPPLCC